MKSVQAAKWLETFDGALARGELASAASLFAPESYWRDLVAFTWNIRTCEGRGEIQAMLAASLSHVQPSKWTVRGADDDGAWFSFETALGRGIGHLRLRDEQCWTLLTTLQELKGFEEKTGRHARGGRRARRRPGTQDLARAARARRNRSTPRARRSPMCSSSAAARAASRSPRA